MKKLEGGTEGSGRRFALVVSRFNELVTGRLTEGALAALRRHGAREQDLLVISVPGAWEIPPVARRLSQRPVQWEGGERALPDAILCIGAVILGGTDHYRYVCERAAQGIAAVGDGTEIPVLFGVLTCTDLEQALARSGTGEGSGNKGEEVAMAALEMVDLCRQLGDAADA